MAFASPNVKTESESGTVTIKNDPIIRQLSIVSLMAVFKDIAPGYRIRKLTEKELSEKVSQAVGQTRDWEQGLVSVYQSYLQLLEKEIKGMFSTLRMTGVLIMVQNIPNCWISVSGACVHS